MKKIIIILFVITLICLFFSTEEQIIIPNTAIRFRIIANSDSAKDQNLKRKIKEDIEPTLLETLSRARSINEARKSIQNYIPKMEEKINNHTTDYKVNFGNNYFPEKVYKGVTYPEGEYESLVVTLGNGLGENWWCVLFPPLCLLEGEETETHEPDYKFYVREILNKFMN